MLQLNSKWSGLWNVKKQKEAKRSKKKNVKDYSCVTRLFRLICTKSGYSIHMNEADMMSKPPLHLHVLIMALTS